MRPAFEPSALLFPAAAYSKRDYVRAQFTEPYFAGCFYAEQILDVHIECVGQPLH